jgi:hypothetical protein
MAWFFYRLEHGAKHGDLGAALLDLGLKLGDVRPDDVGLQTLDQVPARQRRLRGAAHRVGGGEYLA